MSATRLAWVLLLSITASGCSTLSYYQQAISGHLSLNSQRQSIERLLNSPETPDRLRQQLIKVNSLTAFAREQLDLPPQGAYSSYADLQRRYVVWNVFAAPELSLQSKAWCYPFAGCANYRGYYSEEIARQYARQLKEQGLDVYVAGITAYSTLGWFNDPVLNTFIYRSDAQLANLIFHELAHQKLYSKGDTHFNESFATVVAREGVKRWLQYRHDPGAYQGFLEEEAKQQQFVELVLEHRNRLANIYESCLNSKQKRQQKQQIIEQLRNAHQHLKTQWGGQSLYDAWFTDELNNAQLNTVATYFDLVPQLEALLAANGFSLPAFYQASRQFIAQRKNDD